MQSQTALLIIDAQVNMFEAGSSVFEGEKMLHMLGSLIAQMRAAQGPVIYVQNNGGEADPDWPGTPGWEIHPALAPQAGESVIQKRTPDSFHETNLQSVLEARHFRRLIIAGMQTDFCIEATCRRAHAMGYDVTLVKDAHSTYDGGGRTAAQTIAEYNEALKSIIKVEEASRLTFA
jgi:nicotinamidase-related amidase